MAILKKFELRVLSNKSALAEYDDDDAQLSAHKVTKYVEAIPGATFALELNVMPSYPFVEDYLSWQIEVDGQDLVSPIIQRSELHRKKGAVDYRSAIEWREGADWHEQKFQFSQMPTGESD